MTKKCPKNLTLNPATPHTQKIPKTKKFATIFFTSNEQDRKNKKTSKRIKNMFFLPRGSEKQYYTTGNNRKSKKNPAKSNEIYS